MRDFEKFLFCAPLRLTVLNNGATLRRDKETACLKGGNKMYKNYVFDIYGTLLDISTNEHETAT